MTDGSTAFTKICSLSHCWWKTSSRFEQKQRASDPPRDQVTCQSRERLVRCHARARSQSSNGDGPREENKLAADGLWLVLWTLLIFLLPLVSISRLFGCRRHQHRCSLELFTPAQMQSRRLISFDSGVHEGLAAITQNLP